MKTTELTPRQQRQRKALLLLPCIVLPFLTLLFWALGGGEGETAKAAAPGGLNTQLPKALLTNDPKADKLSFYDKAQQDSLDKLAARKKDPYSTVAPDTAKTAKSAIVAGNEAQVYQKLAALQATINKPAPAAPVTYSQPATINRPVKNVEDPELKQMGQLLDKVMAIQNPEKVKAKTDTARIQKFRAIPAIIEGKQKITDGSVIRLKLLDTVTLHGQIFPKGQEVYGSGRFYDQRCLLQIKSIRLGLQICPVDLTVFDMQDGLEGLSVPEAITSGALKDGSVNGIDNMQFLSMDATIASQAASAGLSAAKGIFHKKVKPIKVKLADGRALLLRNNEAPKK